MTGYTALARSAITVYTDVHNISDAHPFKQIENDRMLAVLK